ncbi:HNH endonuclease signature motif containing protein [Barnesiella intestinihominis]|uniref:HNH endonuclease signature motif containing protein n=1 Tax=Barnesiella intestinihominis TaxID=487174 RepID=UPI002665D9CB|nr:endonuclease [Barnesiella intestinihominis]
MNCISRNCLLLVVLTCLFPFFVFAEIPAGYYDDAVGKSGEDLQKSLSTILNDANDVGYNGLWNLYKTTDRRSDGKVWDMYSNVTNYTFGTDQCGSYGVEGDCYNREHSVPKSWFNKQSPMVSDIWHVYPTDGKINGMRSNNPFGEVGSGASSSKNEFSKWGKCVTPGYSGTVFEPNDEYKGDFARTYFYFATRYKGVATSGQGALVFTSTYPYITGWQLDMLLRWHKKDPVSPKELDRNEAVYDSRQGNRNPFIDYPELVDLIFGDSRNIPFMPDGGDAPYIEAPRNGSTVDMGIASVNSSSPVTVQLSVRGRNIESAVSVEVGGNDSECFSVNRRELTADEVNNGTTVELAYRSSVVGSHEAVLEISGGGLKSPVVVNLKGQAIDDFVALPAKDITENSFVAAWTPKSEATDYELNVWYDDYSSSAPEKDILDVTFSSKPDSWTYEEYTAVESGKLRLGSGKDDGIAISPVVDLSADDVSITVEASPYRTTDNSVLYILVDDEPVDEISLPEGTVTKTIPFKGGSKSSKIKFRAEKGHRVYLHSVKVKSGGGFTMVALDGYPRRVGDVNEYKVSDLTPAVQYHYTVTPYVGEVAQSVSNTISVSTWSAAVDDMEADRVLIFTSGNVLHILNAPMNAVASWYTMDGRLCGSRILHSEEVEWELPEGIYIVRVVSPSLQNTVRVHSSR